MNYSQIPIQNIYYLLSYSWDKLEEANKVNISLDSFDNLLNLFSKVLSNTVTHLYKQGLDRDYIDTTEKYPGIKGKIDFSQSINHNTFIHGKAYCSFDELSDNILQNQIIKSTLGTLKMAKLIDKKILKGITTLYNRLTHKDCLTIQKHHFRMVQIHKNNNLYGFIIKICEFIFDNLSFNELEGKYQFLDFVRKEKKMNLLFQDFVNKFYKSSQNYYKVESPKIKWDLTSSELSTIQYIPEMQTDIALVRKNKVIIIDTKFYKKTLNKHYRGTKQRINSKDLYQIYSYIRNYKSKNDKLVQGILLYPTIDAELSLEYKIDNNKISIYTVNLNQHWTQIEKRLLSIVGL